MILPKNNISIMDVRNAIGYPSMDLGTLCSAGEKYINKWSKYKPVHANFTTNRSGDWWKGTERNCGISYLQHASIKYLIDSINSGASQHPYLAPSGGINSPFRLGDFCGYNSDSLAPIHAGNFEGTYYKNNNTIGFAAMLGAGSAEDELTVADVFGSQLQNMYYAAALQATNGSILWLTCTTDVKNGGSFVTFPTSYLNANTTYYLYQFLSSYLKPSITTSESAGQFIAIPGEQKQIIKIESTNIDISIEAEWNNRIVSGTIHIVNRGSTTTFSNVAVHVKYSTSKPEDTMVAGETIIKLSNITVTTNGTTTVPFQSNSNTLPEFTKKGGKCILYMNNKIQAQTFIPMQVPEN